MKEMADCSVDSIVTDPPYELGFMGKSWDSSGIAYNVELWRQCLRVLKPGGHLLAFSGSRTYHRMTCAIEDAGFEVRDQIMWVYGSGFPKSLDVSKQIDKAAGAEREVVGVQRRSQVASDGWDRPWKHEAMKNAGSTIAEFNITAPATAAAQQWQGWGTALKPAHEPICVARKPLIGNVAANVLAHGTGALNIDGCRVATDDVISIGSNNRSNASINFGMADDKGAQGQHSAGRWPANLIHDGSEEVTDRLGEPARFFYCAKASKADRETGNNHPTVKPTELMRYLCRLVTPPGGIVLDPFTGSGSTGKAAVLEGFQFIGIDMTSEYIAIADARIKFALNQSEEKKLINKMELI
jgi:site-specific DNA-methyltransferase (adenine-specific)